MTIVHHYTLCTISSLVPKVINKLKFYKYSIKLTRVCFNSVASEILWARGAIYKKISSIHLCNLTYLVSRSVHVANFCGLSLKTNVEYIATWGSFSMKRCRICRPQSHVNVLSNSVLLKIYSKIY